MEPTPNELKNTSASAGNYASEKARHAASNIQEKVEKSQARLGDIYHTARDRAEDYYDTSVDFVKKYPVSTVMGAAAIGFVAGILLRRTKH